jgi:hypothetical protein
MVHTAKYSLRPYHAVGLGLRGEVLIQRGKLDEGIVLLEQSLDRLRTDRHQILDAAFMSDLAQALALAGQPDRASKTIALAIETVGDNTSFHVPECTGSTARFLRARFRRTRSRLKLASGSRWNWRERNRRCPENSNQPPRWRACGEARAASSRPTICFGRSTVASLRVLKPRTCEPPGCCWTTPPRDRSGLRAGSAIESIQPPRKSP